MRKQQFFIILLLTLTVCGASALSSARTPGDVKAQRDESLLGIWAINFIVPVSPKGNDFGQPHRHLFTFTESGDQRVVTAQEILNIKVPGVWRISGDDFSAAFEFTCPDDVVCGTVTMRGTITGDAEMRGRVVVIWDEGDDTTQTGYDTVTGTFTGEKCSGPKANHDTGGCESLGKN